MIVKKTPEQIEKMAAAGNVLVKTLNLLRSKVRPGVTTGELDAAAEKFIRSHDAEPAFKGYRGFPGSICTSPNSMVVHGIPGPYRLSRGDILSVDVGVVLDGWVADAACTFPVGPISTRLLSGMLMPAIRATASPDAACAVGWSRSPAPRHGGG